MTDIAFFGGSFNPPHLGHEAVARFLTTVNLFDQVWIVPTYQHAFSKKLADYSDRLEMCRRAFSHLSSKIVVSDIEKEWGQNPSYTIDVIRFLKKKQPLMKIWLVIGSDCALTLHSWHKYHLLKNEVNFLFLPRTGYVESPFPDISSSQIRECLRQKKSCDKLLDNSVEHYILNKKIYGSI